MYVLQVNSSSEVVIMDNLPVIHPPDRRKPPGVNCRPVSPPFAVMRLPRMSKPDDLAAALKLSMDTWNPETRDSL
jgi:hypothetical protein